MHITQGQVQNFAMHGGKSFKVEKKISVSVDTLGLGISAKPGVRSMPLDLENWGSPRMSRLVSFP